MLTGYSIAGYGRLLTSIMSLWRRDILTKECLNPGIKKLVDYHGQKIRLPNNESNWPDPKYIKWHRDHRFKSG